MRSRPTTRTPMPGPTPGNHRSTILRTSAPARSGAWRSTMTSKRFVFAFALLAVALAGATGTARAQFTLGGQRAGTSSGSFLKIGVGARAVALGESYVAVANDPSTIYWNPAGLASLQRQEVQFSHADWPADVHYEHAVWVLPSRRFGGSFAFQLGVLSTEMDETTELNPFGTGRSFLYSDLVAGMAY